MLYRDGGLISGAIFIDNEDVSPARLRKAIDAIPEVPDLHRLDVLPLVQGDRSTAAPRGGIGSKALEKSTCKKE